jgi:DNA-directed RNA polymerase specialized sigma24 family protein
MGQVAGPNDADDEDDENDFEDNHFKAPLIPRKPELITGDVTYSNQHIKSKAKGLGDITYSEIAAYINKVPEPYRTIVRLRFLEAQSYGEISRQLQFPIGTIKSYINRGMKKLQNLSRGVGNAQQNQVDDNEIALNGQAGILVYLDRLQEPYQSAIRLHYLEKLSYPEIAQRLRRPIGTVKSYVNRGMKILQNQTSE